jgi:ABC-type sugar transport system permease subunit
MALTEGGPGTATQVVSLQIYADAFKYFRLGVASAEGVILTIIIFIISLWVRRGDNDEA